MDEELYENDARLITTLEIDLDSKDPAMAEKLAALKPLLRDILRIVRESRAEQAGDFGKVEASGGGFTKVSCANGFHKVTYCETICK